MKNKNTLRWWILLALLLVVYNVLAFAIPFKHTGVFALSYAFTMIAILAQAYVIRSAFYRGEGVRSKFYCFPIAVVGAVYLAVQLVLGFIFMALGAIAPLWLALVLYVVALAAGCAGFIAADAVRDEVERQDAVQEKQVGLMRSLQAESRAIARSNRDAGCAAALEKLAESFRYSDPVSCEASAAEEAGLKEGLARLRAAVESADGEAAAALCRELESALARRNELCRAGKKG